ncbi:hypothetical protein EDD52_101770 [Primorskyibacter sedentarius]|uniref:Uncharacterized protein n=2 Tax=Primorskyibacter sedentarius TaxID=745311 RepID=A0A4R3JMP3_9RHOB|nr:hypothetical protein EDD52_101770 [Primorskyibacter sedentarius]
MLRYWVGRRTNLPFSQLASYLSRGTSRWMDHSIVWLVNDVGPQAANVYRKMMRHLNQQHPPVSLNKHEQIVMAVDARIFPSLSDVIFITLFVPVWFFLLVPILHRIFRPITYIITTERILAVEPNGKSYGIGLDGITKMKGTKTSLMIYGAEDRLWLPRLPDAWFFESVVWNVVDKVGLSDGKIGR